MKHPVLRFLVLGLAVVLVVAGCNTSTKKKDYDTAMARFLVEAKEGDAFAAVTLPVSGVQIAVNNRAVLTEFDIVAVESAQSELGRFLIFKLTNDAARDIYRVTGTNQGRRLVLFVNGAPLGARMIDRPFNDGTVAVFAAIPEADLDKLVRDLNLTSIDLQKEIAKAK